MPFNVIADTLHISDALKASVTDFARETFHVKDAISTVNGNKIVDTLHVSDFAQGFDTVVIRDTLHISDAMKTSVGFATARDSLRFSEAILAVARNVVADTLHIADVMSNTPSAGRALDLLHIADSIPNTQNFVGVSHDFMRLADVLRAQVSAVLTDTLHVSETLRNVGGANRVADTMHVADAFAVRFAGFDAIADVLHVADNMLHAAVITNVLRDHLFIGDAIDPKGDMGGAWACSTDLYAMSRYIQKRLDSIGVVSDHVLVSGEGGIYLHEGLDDNGATINAHAETGFIQVGVPEARDINAKDAGDPSLKRGSYVYLSYSGGPMRFGIGITRNGVETRYWYPFPARVADVPTTNRTKLGRGATSGFWRFLLENIGGASFMVKEQRAVLDKISRRL